MDPPPKKLKAAQNLPALGIYPLIIKEFLPYFVCEENRKKITQNFIQFLMGNNVAFDTFDNKAMEKAIDYRYS